MKSFSLLIALFGLILLVGLPACALFGAGLPGPVRQGLKSSGIQSLGGILLDRWDRQFPFNTRLEVLRGVNASTQHPETRAFISSRDGYVYLGALSHLGSDLPVERLCFDVFGVRYLLGAVKQGDLPGEAGVIEFRRQPMAGDRDDDLSKSATVEDGIFFFPIYEDEIARWEAFSDLMIVATGDDPAPLLEKHFEPAQELFQDCVEVYMEAR